MNPYADAANKKEKLPAEKKRELERLVLNALLGEAVIGTIMLYVWIAALTP